MVKSPFPWVGGKSKLLWLIHKLFPSKISTFVDVFGGSGTVLLSRPVIKGVLEIYNDFNSNLTNLMYCIKKRPFLLLEELAFLPLNARDEFSVLLKFFLKKRFTDEYLEENLELAERYLSPPEFEQIKEDPCPVGSSTFCQVFSSALFLLQSSTFGLLIRLYF